MEPAVIVLWIYAGCCFVMTLESIKDLFNNKVKCRKIGR